MSKIVERIYQFVEYKRFSISEFSKIINVSNGYFAKQKSNKANIGSNILEKIVSEFSEINTEWLLTGSGEMLKKARAPDIILEKPIEKIMESSMDIMNQTLQNTVAMQQDFINALKEQIKQLICFKEELIKDKECLKSEIDRVKRDKHYSHFTYSRTGERGKYPRKDSFLKVVWVNN